MSKNGKTPDNLDKAVEASQQVQMFSTGPVALASDHGKVFTLTGPAHITAADMLEYVSWLTNPTNGIIAQIEAAKKPASNLVVARGPLPPPRNIRGN